MSYLTFYLIYLATLALPALVALVIRKRVQPRHRPILAFMWVIFAWEILRVFTSENSIASDFAVNTQPLVETLVITWIAKRWNLFEKKPAIFFILPAAVILIWTADKMSNGLNNDFSWVNVGLSLLNVTLATLFLSRTLFSSFTVLLRNPVFLFSAALIFHYSLSLVIEGMLLVIRPSGTVMQENMFYGAFSIGILTNLIYFNTILCISKAARYSLA
jgi:hypothetical protein